MRNVRTCRPDAKGDVQASLWINYYGHFYKSALLQTLRRIDAYLIRWGRYKYNRLRARTAGARDWFARVVRAHPALFAHWRLLYVGGRTSGAV